MKDKTCVFSVFSFFIFFFSCSANYSPKPRAYFYIDLPDPVYYSLQTDREETLAAFPFTFDVSAQTRFEFRKDLADTLWFNLNYPKLNAKIYCSYFHINKESFGTISEECRKLAYAHELRAERIE
jgi:hypothetical protein